MNQVEFDNAVLAFTQRGVDLMYITAKMKRQGDPDVRRLEQEYMFLQNVVSALRDYDITSDLLSTANIDYLFELATNVLQRCPAPN
jgi:hypothetical protein